ncbi:MAG: acetyltransferase [Pseudomonadota bacterium]
MGQKQFEEWAIVEIFGHQRIAGKVSEQTIGGCSFVRVDVPECPKHQAFTKLYGQGAIYAMTITDEKTARMAAESYAPEPMDRWTMQRMIEQLPAPDNRATDRRGFGDENPEDYGEGDREEFPL